MDNLEGQRPDVRNEDPIEREAISLGIPRENWNHPTVRRFLQAYTSALEARDQLSHLAHDAFKDNRFDDQGWVFQETKQEAAKHPIQEGLPPNPNLKERYSAAELVMGTAIEILRGGLTGEPTPATYMQGKLNSALGQFGLEVVKAPPIPRTKRPPTQ